MWTTIKCRGWGQTYDYEYHRKFVISGYLIGGAEIYVHPTHPLTALELREKETKTQKYPWVQHTLHFQKEGALRISNMILRGGVATKSESQ